MAKEPDKDDKKKKMAKLNSGVKSKSAKAKAIAGYMGKMAVDPKNC